MSQSNTQQGQIVLPSDGNLKDKEGFLVHLTNPSGSVTAFGLTAHDPATIATVNTPNGLFVITDGGNGADGETTSALPLSPDRSIRAKLAGTCEIGKYAVLTPDSAAGTVSELPTANGTYVVVGVAEEAGVDGQLLKIRPYRTGERITISS